MEDITLDVIPIEDEVRFREIYNTGVRRFPVGKNIPCQIVSFESTPSSVTFTCQWGPYETDRGLPIKPQKETITYSDSDELLSPYKLMRLIKEINPDAKFLERDNPEFYTKLGEELMNKHLLANSIEIKVPRIIGRKATINKTQIIFLKNVDTIKK